MITRCLCFALAVLTALPGAAEDQRDATLQPETSSPPQPPEPNEILPSKEVTETPGATVVAEAAPKPLANSIAGLEDSASAGSQPDTVNSSAADAGNVSAAESATAAAATPKMEGDSAGPAKATNSSTPAPETAEEKNTASTTAASETVQQPAVTEAAPADPATPLVDPLVMLGETVQPGTAAKLAWVAQESFEGISAPTPVLVVHGARPGPKLCVTAGVHGDELNGIEVVRRIIYDLNPAQLTGSVIGVPIVNLQGFRRASRYLPDRRDLNRYFPGSARGSSASRIAHAFFQSVIIHCDLLVDLHTGSFHRTNLPQLRADLHNPSVKELAQNMGSIVVLHSRGAGGSLRRAATDRGIPAVTLEAGEPHKVDLDAVDHGVLSVQALLHKRGMYERRSMWTRQIEPMYYKSRWVRAPNGGILTSRITLGERVKIGDVLGTVTDPITNYSVEINTPIDGRVIGMALNQVMQPGFAAYHIGFQSTAEEAAKHDAGPDDASGDELEMDRPLGQNKAGKGPAAEDAE